MATEAMLKSHWRSLAKNWWKENGAKVGAGAICDSCMGPVIANSGYYSPYLWRNELFCDECAITRAHTVIETIDQHTNPSCLQEYHDATSTLSQVESIARDPEYLSELSRSDPKFFENLAEAAAKYPSKRWWEFWK